MTVELGWCYVWWIFLTTFWMSGRNVCLPNYMACSHTRYIATSHSPMDTMVLEMQAISERQSVEFLRISLDCIYSLRNTYRERPI